MKSDGAVGAAGDGDAFQSGAVNEGGEDEVEDHPVGDTAAVAAQRMSGVELGSWG
jgi:hypothetical protein